MSLTAGNPLTMTASGGMRHSIFWVQGHHPALPGTAPALYQQVVAQGKPAESGSEVNRWAA